MNLFSRFMGREKRSQTVKASDPYLAEYFGRSGGITGYADIGKSTATSVAHACIQTIAQNIAQVPLHLHRSGANGGRERAKDHPLYSVLQHAPNPSMTAFEFRECMTASLLTYGNAFARIEWNGRGQVSALYPVHPSYVSIETLTTGRMRYRISDQWGHSSVYLQEEVLHLRYRIGADGMTGLSPIQIASGVFSLAVTQQEQAEKQARRAFRPEGVISFPNPIGPTGATDVLEKMRAKVEANNETSGVLVMDGGVTWTNMSFSSKDAEFLESRKHSDLAIARIFGVPPTVIGITDNATYSNVDGESRALVTRCLAPMARRIEQAMNAALLTVESRKTLFIEHDLAGLMRGDLKSRYEAYRIGREWGWISANEIRGWENLTGIEGGDEYITLLNMSDSSGTGGAGDGNE